MAGQFGWQQPILVCMPLKIELPVLPLLLLLLL
jgi:hypothetical protein